MKQSLQLKLGQHLTMTPQLQQATRPLQLSSMELSVEIQEALDSNMMLELADGSDEYEDGTPGINGDESDDGEHEVGGGDPSEAEAETTTQDIPEDLPVDSQWEDIYDGFPTPGSGSPGREAFSSEVETASNREESLFEHLIWQINLMPLGETDYVIALAVIDALDNDGYLYTSIEDLCTTITASDDVATEADEVEAVLKLVQGLDPAGVGARNIGECLLLQLAQLPDETEWLAEARRCCSEYMEILGARDYNQLMRKLKLGKEDLSKVIALIQSMNPRPGARYNAEHAEYIVPDVFVSKEEGRWRVELNSDTIPPLRVNPYYAGLIKRADNSDDNSSLKAHLQEARWFIKSLRSRSETLLRVATSIVERQRAFLEHGEEAMKPLVLHDIAEILEMHESTISRVTTRKYMHTPRGIFELKYFFSSHVSTTLGGEASSTAIRAVIKKLIAAENIEKPLSDNKIAVLLSDQGVKVARRTVAKYREAMAIPPSNERKGLA
jgi:RNA polymerase sigma-54 factor